MEMFMGTLLAGGGCSVIEEPPLHAAMERQLVRMNAKRAFRCIVFLLNVGARVAGEPSGTKAGASYSKL
jgi:hypothetical protein